MRPEMPSPANPKAHGTWRSDALTSRRRLSSGNRDRSGALLAGAEGVFDAAGDLVDRAGEKLDALDRLLGVPAGEVGDALTAGVEAGARADDAGDALDDQLGFGAAEAL